MPKCHRNHARCSTPLLGFTAGRVITAITWVRSRLRHDCPVPLEVLISGAWRRRSVKHRLRHAIDRLQRVLPSPLPLDVAIVVQPAIVTQRQLPACYQISQRPDGSRFALIRLALQVDGRRLSPDELLAVLAEQYIALAMQSTGPSLLVPIDLDPSTPGGLQRPTTRRSDPLAPRPESGERSA